MRNTIFIALISMLAFPATANAQDCRPAFSDGDQSLSLNGDSIEPGGRATENFTVRILNEARTETRQDDRRGFPGQRCEARLRIARIGALPGPDFPPYSLRTPRNRQIEVLPDAASGGTTDSDVPIANVPAGPEGRAVPVRLSVPTEWGLRAGTYTEQLELLLIDDAGNIADRSSLTLTIIIPPASSLRLVGAVVGSGDSGPAQIDLGNLSSTTETRSNPFAARIFSTAPYSVEFSSANMGSLLHEQGSEQIPYRLFFDGTEVDLAGTYEIAFPEHTSQAGDRRAMRIVVPPVVALAGSYSDRITMTVTAM
ncbi:hypothetical protein [Henriciella sp.]|uniref:hypothetical protein n=1 Tax=Henriciella sp. TaxID=1968823 RepID=UPI00261366A4|nr:hypothetical protein [Henriciella sp.]